MKSILLILPLLVANAHLRALKKSSSDSDKRGKSKKTKNCDPDKVELSDYAQWEDEKGYWVGEYSFFGSNGDPYVSSSWPYPYDHYRGFITGNIEGNAYRQRNVFLYSPLPTDQCSDRDPNVTKPGICGVNGNAKTFQADQAATTCSTNPALGGIVEGDYQGLYTITELIGRDNALLYQVFFPENLFFQGQPEFMSQSQLTTITTNGLGERLRTRTAQGFNSDGSPSYASFYRERNVPEEEFWALFNETVHEYNILASDLCLVEGNYVSCEEFLEQSFQDPFAPLSE